MNSSAIRWTDETLENAIVALRDIKPGEEISISCAYLAASIITLKVCLAKLSTRRYRIRYDTRCTTGGIA